MIPEQKHAFAQIIDYIKTTSPAAVVIAGDVYDRAIPSVEAVRVFDDFLTQLAHQNIAVILISGNHDSPERINYASRLLADKHIYFYGAFDGTMRKVTLSDEYGEVNFWLLPFIKPASVRGLLSLTCDETEDETEKEIETYDQAIAAAIETAKIDYTARNVLVSHQFYTKTGINPIQSDSELNPVGGLDAIDTEIIENFDYIALGHLHANQRVGAEHIRYCGSPIKYSFSEYQHKKSITLVELGEKGDLTTTALPLTPLHDMRKLKGKLEILLSGELPEQGSNEDYMHITLTNEDEIVDPMGKLRSIYPNIMHLGFENSRTDAATSIMTDSETIKKLSDYELFAQFFLEAQGSTMSEDQAEIIRQLLDRVDEE